MINKILTYFAIFLIRIYQTFISPIIGGRYHCKFHPRCSDYSIEVLKNFGILKGSCLTIKRILKCNPFSKGGLDLPPQKSKEK
ncbi:membrane protein insertion efficiency factor YidD [bacterium]|nr:membrane protein insertion efficiency factor YidD [bacterium]